MKTLDQKELMTEIERQLGPVRKCLLCDGLVTRTIKPHRYSKTYRNFKINETCGKCQFQMIMQVEYKGEY